jgi:hypothetical protein
VCGDELGEGEEAFEDIRRFLVRVFRETGTVFVADARDFAFVGFGGGFESEVKKEWITIGLVCQIARLRKAAPERSTPGREAFIGSAFYALGFFGSGEVCLWSRPAGDSGPYLLRLSMRWGCSGFGWPETSARRDWVS